MNTNLPQWGKDVKKALIDRGTTIKGIAEEVGCCASVISQLVNGRYAKPNRIEIAKKINAILETTGLPPKPETQSDEWCKSVKKALIDKNMNIGQLADAVNSSREKVSLIINGYFMDEQIVNKINKLLDVNSSVASLKDN